MQFWEHQKIFFPFTEPVLKRSVRTTIRIRKLTKSHVSVAVNSLIQRNLLKPFHTDNNHKTVHLRLLPAARDIIQSGRQAQEQFRDQLFQGFSEEELQLFRDMTDRILHNASQKEDSHL